MLGPNELLNKILEFGKNEFQNGQLNIKKTDLWNYVIKIDPDARKENLIEVITELDARGWLLTNNDIEVKFDPATFQ